MSARASAGSKGILVHRLIEAGIPLRCFLKVNKEKKAFETEWQKHLYTPEELKDYPRWGINGCNGLVLVDVDKDEIIDVFRKDLPVTFEAISPRRKLPHFYYKVVGGEVENKVLHLPNDKEGAGEIRAQNHYLVAPGTEITYEDLETGEKKTGKYEILHNRAIAAVSYPRFMKVVTPYLGSIPSQRITHQQMREGVPQGTRHAQGMKYASFLVKVQRFDYATALEEMKRWNQLCRPPMEEKDLERMVPNAIAYPDRKKTDPAVMESASEEYQGKETYPELLKTIGYTVKRDNIAKQFDLLHVLSMYAAPINELKEAPASEGKTYPLMQIIRLFPKEDIMVLGGLSPTALAHDYGMPVDREGNDLSPAIREIHGKIEKLKDELVDAERNEKAKIRRDIEKLQREISELMKGSKRLIDLENKTIIFVDNPDPRTWAKLRPIMSHDKWETTYKFTDRSSKSGPLKQVTVVLRGWPVFIAFKAEETPNKGWTQEIWNQILTRGTTVPVEMSTEKYGEAIKLTGVKKGLPQPLLNGKLHLEDFKNCRKIVRSIRARILAMKKAAREQTQREELPNIFWIPFYDVVAKNFPKTKGTHMREADRFLSIIQNHATANVFNRPTVEINGVSYLICTLHDLAKALELYFSDEARKTIFSKIPTNQIRFFEKVILPLSKSWPGGISTAKMQNKYKEVFGESISVNTINYHYLQPLENMDIISRDEDESDKRRKLTVPLREEVFTEKEVIRTLFEKGDFFTVDSLKGAYDELKKLIVSEPQHSIIKLKDCDGSTIAIEKLHETYFSKNSLTAQRFSNNYLSEQEEEPKTPEKPEKPPVTKKEPIPPKTKTVFKALAEAKLGVCELCGNPETLTHSFELEGQKRLACSSCAKGD